MPFKRISRETGAAEKYYHGERAKIRAGLDTLPLGIQKFAEKHPYWFWILTIGTVATLGALKEFHRNATRRIS